MTISYIDMKTKHAAAKAARKASHDSMRKALDWTSAEYFEYLNHDRVVEQLKAAYQGFDVM